MSPCCQPITECNGARLASRPQPPSLLRLSTQDSPDCRDCCGSAKPLSIHRVCPVPPSKAISSPGPQRIRSPSTPVYKQGLEKRQGVDAWLSGHGMLIRGLRETREVACQSMPCPRLSIWCKSMWCFIVGEPPTMHGLNQNLATDHTGEAASRLGQQSDAPGLCHAPAPGSVGSPSTPACNFSTPGPWQASSAWSRKAAADGRGSQLERGSPTGWSHASTCHVGRTYLGSTA